MEKFSLLLLLVAITAIRIHSTNAQNGDDNDTSEEASGSGMRELPTLPSCHIPASSNLNRVHINLTEEEQEDLMMEGRCYLACTTKKYMVMQSLKCLIIYLHEQLFLQSVVTRINQINISYWPYIVVEGCNAAKKVSENNYYRMSINHANIIIFCMCRYTNVYVVVF